MHMRPFVAQCLTPMDSLSCNISESIATVTLLQSTMTPGFFDEIGAFFAQLAQDDTLRAVVLCSSGKVFSYGLDLREAFTKHGPLMTGGMAASRMRLLGLIRKLQGSFNQVADCPVPVIAAVHSWCVGGGLDLICACDIRLCSADAMISLRETKIAMVADLGSLQRLPRIVGQGHARELAYTGKDIDAARAKAMGLCNEVYPDRDAVHEAAHALAREIADNSPLAVRGVKEVMDFGADRSVAEGLEYVAAWNSAFLASSDLGEAVAAFAARRKPVFKGE